MNWNLNEHEKEKLKLIIYKFFKNKGILEEEVVKEHGSLFSILIKVGNRWSKEVKQLYFKDTMCSYIFVQSINEIL